MMNVLIICRWNKPDNWQEKIRQILYSTNGYFH